MSEEFKLKCPDEKAKDFAKELAELLEGYDVGCLYAYRGVVIYS